MDGNFYPFILASGRLYLGFEEVRVDVTVPLPQEDLGPSRNLPVLVLDAMGRVANQVSLSPILRRRETFLPRFSSGKKNTERFFSRTH